MPASQRPLVRIIAQSAPHSLFSHCSHLLLGVTKVDIDLATKKVVVQGTASDEAINAALVKSGKTFKRIES